MDLLNSLRRSPGKWNSLAFSGFPPWHARVGMVILSYLLMACDYAPRPPSAQSGTNQTTQWPTTLEAAAEDVIGRMNPQELDAFSSMSRKDLVRLNQGLGTYIRNRYGLGKGNTELTQSVCQHIRYKALCEPDTVSKLIIESAWKTLQTRNLCKKSGGHWVHDGMFGQAQYCQFTYADGGKPCRSSKECTGGCVIYDLPVNGKPRSAAGVCRFTNSIFGCWAPIENPGRYICFD